MSACCRSPFLSFSELARASSEDVLCVRSLRRRLRCPRIGSRLPLPRLWVPAFGDWLLESWSRGWAALLRELLLLFPSILPPPPPSVLDPSLSTISSPCSCALSSVLLVALLHLSSCSFLAGTISKSSLASALRPVVRGARALTARLAFRCLDFEAGRSLTISSLQE